MRHAFTLIELLVVITIIVVLLALLTPALDKAVYQAQLTLCGTKLHAIGVGVTSYALENKRRYPERPAVYRNGERSFIITYDGTLFDGKATEDLRPILRSYLNINGHLQCALAPEEVDLELPGPDSNNTSSYGLWFGFKYTAESEGMKKIGDRVVYQGDRLDVLAGDYDSLRNDNKIAFGAHPDHDNTRLSEVRHNEPLIPGVPTMHTYAMWISAPYRGPVDSNYLFQDGSVELFRDVAWDEGDPATDSKRFVWLPEYAAGASSGHPTWMIQLPHRP